MENKYCYYCTRVFNGSIISTIWKCDDYCINSINGNICRFCCRCEKPSSSYEDSLDLQTEGSDMCDPCDKKLSLEMKFSTVSSAIKESEIIINHLHRLDLKIYLLNPSAIGLKYDYNNDSSYQNIKYDSIVDVKGGMERLITELKKKRDKLLTRLK